jgi:hypothetical protein
MYAKANKTERITSSAIANNIIQRKINVFLNKKDSKVIAKTDSKRPPGAIFGKQGDHLTPFAVLQAQIKNAVHLQTLPEAWSSLHTTFRKYEDLPGWSNTKKSVLKKAYDYLLPLLEKQGSIGNLQKAVNLMLEVRNQVGLSAVKGGTKGHGEGKWHGGLQYLEEQLQKNSSIGNTTTNDVLFNMFNLFEHQRFNAMNSNTKKELVIEQHAMTITDAYPSLSERLKIEPQKVIHYFNNH